MSQIARSGCQPTVVNGNWCHGPRTRPALNRLPPSPICECGHPEPAHLWRGRARRMTRTLFLPLSPRPAATYALSATWATKALPTRSPSRSRNRRTAGYSLSSSSSTRHTTAPRDRRTRQFATQDDIQTPPQHQPQPLADREDPRRSTRHPPHRARPHDMTTISSQFLARNTSLTWRHLNRHLDSRSQLSG
jgi:hypothetical protein